MGLVDAEVWKPVGSHTVPGWMLRQESDFHVTQEKMGMCIKLSMESYTWKSTDVGQNYVKLLMSPCGTHISNSCYPRGNVKQFLDEF